MSRFFFLSPSTISRPSLFPANPSPTIPQNSYFVQEPYGPTVVDSEVIIVESVSTVVSPLDQLKALLEPSNEIGIQPNPPIVDRAENRLLDPKTAAERHKEVLADMRKRLLLGNVSMAAYTSLLTKYLGDTVQCKFCGISLPARHNSLRRKELRAVSRPCPHRLIDHARRHLASPNIVCPLCDFKGVTRSAVIHHLKHRHNTTPGSVNLNERINELGMEELLGMIDRCFGDEEVEPPSDNDLTIYEYCDRAIAKQIKNGSVQCQICERMTRIRCLERRGLTGPIEHAVSHLRKELFWCRLCDYRSCTNDNFRRHVKRAHKESHPGGLFDDKTEEYVNEIKALIDYCYGRPEGLGKSPFTLPPDILEELQKSKRRIVHNRCRDIIIQFAKSNRLICRLCSKDIQVGSDHSKMITRFAIDHASDHYGKPLYHCGSCDKWSTGMQPCIMHVRNSHGGSSAGAYIDTMHEHSEQILRMLDKCFDKNWKDDQFGLEESDDEDGETYDLSKKIGIRFSQDGLGMASKSKNVGSNQVGQKYNLRPRSGKKKWSIKTDSRRKVLNSGKSSTVGFKVLIPRFKRLAVAKMKFMKDDGISYACYKCPMISKYRDLVTQHIKLIHGGI